MDQLQGVWVGLPTFASKNNSLLLQVLVLGKTGKGGERR